MANVILFVDDEPAIVELLREHFPPSLGFEPLTAGSAEEALVILATRPVDLLVTDQRMPGMGGVELVAQARELRPDLTAILVTAYTEPEELVEAINVGGIYRYVTKPWDLADLRQTVRSALEHVNLRRERERLHAELERRLAALRLASDIARDVGVAATPESLFERLLTRLPDIVPCDLAAALVAPEEGQAVLVLDSFGAGEEILIALEDELVAAWSERSGRPLPEGGARIRVVPAHLPARPSRAQRSRLVVPLESAGRLNGLLLLRSSQEEAFGEGDARVLDLLANELAESVRVLAAKLSEERRRIERVVECMADGLLFADAKTEAVIANPAARRMLHAPEGQDLSVRWLKETLKFYPFDLVRGLAQGGAAPALVTEELRIDDRALSSIVSPVTDADGRLAGVAVALRDVTDQRRLDERRQEFVQLMSHELRTPLTAITGALQLVLDGHAGDLPPPQRRFLEMARASADRINQLADDLLDVARSEKGKLELQHEVVYLDELVRTAVEHYSAAAAEKGLDLSVALPDGPLRALADPVRLQQVLSNLLTNAVKFTPERGQIRVALFRSGAVQGWAGLSVWNNGEHIPEEDLERIFEKFEQARSDRNRRVRGSGLGLAICRGIAEAHGGRIWAESAPGQGVRFVLALPPQPGDGRSTAKRLPPGAARLPLPLVLTADDFESAAALKGSLLRHGVACGSAAGPAEIVAQVRTLRPRVLVVDPAARGVDGAALSAALAADELTKDMRVLAFSAPENREKALRLGVRGFLAKPASEEDLVAAVEEQLAGEPRSGHRILVVDDDPAIRLVYRETLAAHGHEVLEAESCREAVRVVRERKPQLLVIDVSLPDGDGFSLLESLAHERSLEDFGAVFVTAHGEIADKVRGFRVGADDYLGKPFEPKELVARVEAVLRRRQVARSMSPVTRLPSGPAIDEEVARRLEAREPFALCYIDLDDFKVYNDHYGYAKADGVIIQTADLIRRIAGEVGGEGAFVGHVGGDDFVLVTDTEHADDTCEQLVAAFDRLIPLYYEREDRERGWIEAQDRFGIRRRFQLMSISVVAVWANPGRFEDHAAIARAAAELKKRAKAVSGSVYLKDAPGAPGAARSA
ncbi:MAG TPA: response regulator [Anaeromyxobacteraceae bacterium]|nr:response regulator [Anaeromyxobacteraceae bacterium]